MDYKGHKNTLEGMNMFIILIMMMVPQVSKLITLYFKHVQCIVYPIIPNKAEKKMCVKAYTGRGSWLAHSEEHATLDLWIVSSSPMLGIEIFFF